MVKGSEKILSPAEQKARDIEAKSEEFDADAGGGILAPGNKKKKKSLKIEKISTGIKNLDKITEGGFCKDSTNVIVGGSGNGKSVFAIQFLIEGIKNGENVLYVSFEEKKNEFYKNMLELGWDLKKYEEEGKFFFLSYTPQKVRNMLEEGGGDIESIVLTKNISRIAMDSVTAFVMLFENEVAMREGTLSLFSMLRSWVCTSLLIYERDPLIDKRAKSRVLEFETDSLIFLYFTRLSNERERFLEVYKMRGTNHSTNIYPYKIQKDEGIVVSESPFKGKLKN